MNVHPKWSGGAIVGLFVLLSACASTPPPKNELTRADTAIKQAEQAGAAEHAPLELREAKKQYEEASQISGKNDDEAYVRAQRLAERAIADAELATALARAKRAESLAGEVREGVKTLQEELDRPAGGVQ